MNMTRILLAALLLCTSAAQAQTISGNTIRDGSTPLSKVVPLAANAVVGNCTGSSASPAACTPTQAKDSIGIVRRFEDYGAVGNGTADDTNALKAAAAAGVIVEGRPGATYRITSRVFGFVNGTRWRGNGARIYMPAASFNNTNLASKYCDTCVGIDLSGLRSSPFTPVSDIEVSNFVIESQVQDGRHVGAIACLNVTDLVIRDNEIFGFPVGAGVRCGSLSGDSKINRNYIHDFYSNATWPGIPQSTGIEVDNDRVSTIVSVGVEIADNRIERIAKGPLPISDWGYQTDGINVQNGSGYRIAGNFIDTVGEAIDTFASDGVVIGNRVSNAYEAGIKLIHGASGNLVSENIIQRAGLAGVFIGGSSFSATDTDRNLIIGNHISEIDYLNVWGSNVPSGILINTDSTLLRKSRNTTMALNRIVPGNGKYAFYDAGSAGGNISSDIYIGSGTVGVYGSVTLGTTRFSVMTPTTPSDNSQLNAGSEVAFAFRNPSSASGSAVSLDLNAADSPLRKAAIRATNNGANQINVAICTSNADLCADRLTITPTGTTSAGILAATGGSAANVSVQAGGDANTGLLFSATDQLDLVTNGVRAFRIDSAQALTFGGVSSATRLLSVDNSGRSVFRFDDNGIVSQSIGQNYGISGVSQGILTSRVQMGTAGTLGATAFDQRVVSTEDWSVSANRSAKLQIGLINDGVTSTAPYTLELDPKVGLTVMGSLVPMMKHQRITTGSIPATSSALVTLTWTAAYADANYSTTCSVVDSTSAAASLRVVHIETVSASAVAVRVENTSAGALTGTLNCMAMHD